MADRPGHRQDLAAPAASGPAENKTARNTKAKIIIACVALVLAGIVLAWNLGLLGSSRPEDARTPQQKQDLEKGYEEQEQLRQQMEQDGPVEIGLLGPKRPGLAVRQTPRC